MRDHRFQADTAGCDHTHQPPHPLLSARAKRRNDLVVAESRCDRTERDLKVVRVDTEARERPTRTQDAEASFERGLRAQRLDCHIHAASTGNAHDLGYWIDLLEVDDMVGA